MYVTHLQVYTYVLTSHCTYFFNLAMPSIRLLVNNTTIGEGNTITITCEALGYPPPTVVWSRTNRTLSDRVSMSEYSDLTRDSRVSVNLTITNASREDTGEYRCFANNSIGSDSSNVRITVESKWINLKWKKYSSM